MTRPCRHHFGDKFNASSLSHIRTCELNSVSNRLYHVFYILIPVSGRLKRISWHFSNTSVKSNMDGHIDVWRRSTTFILSEHFDSYYRCSFDTGLVSTTSPEMSTIHFDYPRYRWFDIQFLISTRDTTSYVDSIQLISSIKLIWPSHWFRSFLSILSSLSILLSLSNRRCWHSTYETPYRCTVSICAIVS
jgi:hypothetical protein